MAKIYLAGTKNVLFEFPNLIMDEFIPVVEFDRSKFEQKYGLLSAGPEVTLSKYIDEGLRKMSTRVVDTESRKNKLPISIKKGHPKTSDFDGIVVVRLSKTDAEIQICGKKSFKVKYGDSIEVEIEIKKNSDVEFDVNFYAQDDDEGEINKGELKDLFCGRIKINFNFRSSIVIVVGTDEPVGGDHTHKSEENFVRRVDRLLNTATTENLMISPNEFVYVLVPPSMSQSNMNRLRNYGARLSHFEVLQKTAGDLTSFVNSISNIRYLTFFGHGAETGPIYEWDVAWFPNPTSFQRTSFADNAIAWFPTCNSKDYAKRFTTALGVSSIGVEGTTFYGIDEISAGRLTKSAAPGTSVGWKFEGGTPGVRQSSYSLNQNTGSPFLRGR